MAVLSSRPKTAARPPLRRSHRPAATAGPAADRLCANLRQTMGCHRSKVNCCESGKHDGSHGCDTALFVVGRSHLRAGPERDLGGEIRLGISEIGGHSSYVGAGCCTQRPGRERTSADIQDGRPAVDPGCGAPHRREVRIVCHRRAPPDGGRRRSLPLLKHATRGSQHLRLRQRAGLRRLGNLQPW